MNRTALSTLTLVGLLGVAGVVRADCCDDAWSCIGAVATAGLSCEVEAIIDTVKALQTVVQTLAGDLSGKTGDMIAEARGSVIQAVADVRQVREQSTTSLNDAVQRSHQLIAAKAMFTTTSVAPKGAVVREGAVAPPSMQASRVTSNGPSMRLAPPADPTAIKEILSKANTYLQDLQSKASPDTGQISEAEKASVDAASRHAPIAQQIGVQLAQMPLQVLENSLADLLSHPERIIDPSAEIDAQINRITSQVPAMLAQLVTEVTQEAMGDLDKVHAPLQHVQDSAAGGIAVVNAMDKVASTRLQSDLEALVRLLPMPPPAASTSSARVLMLPTGITGRHEIIAAAYARAEPTRLPLLVKRKAVVDDIAVKWQSIKSRAKVPVQIDNATKQKVEHDLGQMFAGKKGPELEKKKQELLNEASKRFANEPKTLEKVRQYIEAHAKG